MCTTEKEEYETLSLKQKKPKPINSHDSLMESCRMQPAVREEDVKLSKSLGSLLQPAVE